ncbi:MAG: tRNA (adenosine(37)-N6)-dimethylallyltransferase MiaA [Oscillospiraceae bacterium]|nr:tRNA (adenosine(37)-N6)-dimethylallyltransferase MiaA [Oscillospiraceae bacterium]
MFLTIKRKRQLTQILKRRRILTNKLPQVIAIVGTNASGKSAVGIELAKVFNGEIISADSRQVYRGFDLCCGKVTDEESQIVPHHLLDVRNIGDCFSVADYQTMACSIITQILQRKRIPFIVGGTGLYVSSVIKGYLMRDESVEIELRDKLDKLSLKDLQEKLTPEGRAFLASNSSEFQNRRRIIRVIEKTAHGEPLYYENTPKYNALQLGITWSKETLHKRIDERLDARIERGMIDEVKEYLDQGGDQKVLYNLGLEYRYILWYLTGKFHSITDFKLELSRAIKHFAKRQATWFNRDKSIHWLDMNSDYSSQSRSLISDFLEL